MPFVFESHHVFVGTEGGDTYLAGLVRPERSRSRGRAQCAAGTGKSPRGAVSRDANQEALRTRK